MATDQCPIVVLGASRETILAQRLDTAAAIARGSEQYIVVTGRHEAELMARGLIRRGINKSRIIIEPHAESTNENLEFAHRLLPEARRWVVVTNYFHIPRAWMWAWHLKIPVTIKGAPTPGQYRMGMYLREAFALLHSVTRILWRRMCHALDRRE